MDKTKQNGEAMTQDTKQIINALEQSVAAANEMLNLIKSGKLSIGVDAIPMLALALGTFYYAYASEVLPLLRMQNDQGMN